MAVRADSGFPELRLAAMAIPDSADQDGETFRSDAVGAHTATRMNISLRVRAIHARKARPTTSVSGTAIAIGTRENTSGKASSGLTSVDEHSCDCLSP